MKEKEDADPNSVFNHQFIKEKTAGIDAFLKDLDSYSINELLPQTGLKLSEIKETTELIINNENIIIDSRYRHSARWRLYLICILDL